MAGSCLKLLSLRIINPKPDLHNMNADTKFAEKLLVFLCETIIIKHYHMVVKKKRYIKE